MCAIPGFRIGTIGQLTPRDFADLLEGIRSSLGKMQIALPLPSR
jgi:aspartate aminotransferase-like enzyme